MYICVKENSKPSSYLKYVHIEKEEETKQNSRFEILVIYAEYTRELYRR
jgi:hypothetical protein